MDASEWKKRSARLHLYGWNSGLKTYFHVRQLLVLWDFLLLQEIMEVPGHRGCWMETLGSDCWHKSIVEPTQTRRAAANDQTSKDITYHDLTFILYRLGRETSRHFWWWTNQVLFLFIYIYIYINLLNASPVILLDLGLPETERLICGLLATCCRLKHSSFRVTLKNSLTGTKGTCFSNSASEYISIKSLFARNSDI